MMRFHMLMALLVVGCIAPMPASETHSASDLLSTRAGGRSKAQKFAQAAGDGLSSFSPLSYQALEAPVVLPFPAQGEPFHPFLPPLSPDAASVGTTRDGHLARSQRLPLDHPAMRVMPRQLARGLTFGTPPVVRALVRVAEGVQQAHPGSVLSLGHIARPFGGDIPYSVSHNAGRDVDLAFFYRDLQGNPVEPADFIALDSRGRSKAERVVFDAPRTWTVVKLLLQDPELQVQWLFISKPLRAQLLQHAESLGEPAELLARAEEVLGQPGDSRPHNDHLHLRVMCSEADLGEGCRDMGRLPSFARDPAPVRRARVTQVLGYLTDADPEYRARAAELLGLLGAREAESLLVRQLDDAAPRARVGAARGLELLRQATWAEPADEGAEGAIGPGSGNTGSDGTGSDGAGPGNAGSGNTGSGNAGSGNAGSDGTGSGNTGSDGTGRAEAGSGASSQSGSAAGELAGASAGASPAGVGGGKPGAAARLSEASPESPSATPSIQSPREASPPAELRELADAPWQPQLLEKLRREPDPVVVEAWLALLVRLEVPDLEPLLLSWLKEGQTWTAEQRTTYPGGGLPRDTFEGLPWLTSRGIPVGEGSSKRQLAALALAEQGRLASIPVLLEESRQLDPVRQQQARLALGMLMNRSWTPELEPMLEQQHRSWTAAQSGNTGAHALDTAWLEGFRRVGYGLTSLSLSASGELVKALEGPQPQAYNAHRVLERLTGARLEHAPEQFSDLQVFWWRWMKREGWKYQPKPVATSKSKKKSKATTAPKKSAVRTVKKKKKAR